mgnify:FL=1
MKIVRATTMILFGVLPAFVFFWWMFQGCRFAYLPNPQVIDWGIPQWGRPVVNVALVCFYGAVHSALAQAGAPRPFFMVVAGLTSLGVIVAWQPTEGGLWRIGEDTLSWVVGLAQFLGWLIIQAWCGTQLGFGKFLGWENEDLELVVTGPYCVVRHPMHFILLWNLTVTPAMTADRLAMLIGVCLYLFCGGIAAEEARMGEEFGDEWRAYKANVPMLIPRWW